jgi:hypothetical protein
MEKISKNLFLCFVLLLSVFLNGCVAILFGGASAGATYSIVAGSVQDQLNVTKDRVIEEFISTVEKENGNILSASLVDGKVKAKINGRIVYLTVTEAPNNSTKIKINVRKEFELIPDTDEAVRIYKKLAEKLQ